MGHNYAGSPNFRKAEHQKKVEMSAPDMLKILHTADIHLDGNFTFLGEKGEIHRKQIQKTFDNIVDLARNGGYR